MRNPTHDVEARFRLNNDLAASAKAHAEKLGMTFAELIRQALRRELEDAGVLGSAVPSISARQLAAALLAHYGTPALGLAVEANK